MGFLDNLGLDTWYKVILYIGICGCFGLIFIPHRLDALVASNLFILFLGMIFIGFGEWVMHKPISSIQGQHLLTGTWKEANIQGIILHIFGWMFFLLGLHRIFFG